MKPLNLMVCLVLILTVILPASVAGADNGVDDLRGRWDVEWSFFESGDSMPALILYVNDMRASVTSSNTYYAAGCMRSPDTDAFMPLSLKAVYNLDHSYEVTIYSTVVPMEGDGWPYLIRLKGTVMVGGESVKDDQANGTLITQFATGEWSGLHHDRRQTKCPSVQDAGLGFDGGLYAHRDLNPSMMRSWSLYEGYTVIVSSGMLVETPDGSQVVVQEYTDIFSPDVDFEGRFRYLGQIDGLPLAGGIYQFTLLDIFGDPIPGTESTDVWYGCNQGAPANINSTYTFEDNVLLSWDAVADVPGEFEPGSAPQIGFYQIGISPFNWPSGSDYGAGGIASVNHVVPWNAFEPGAAGTPDGLDFGTALGQLPDGVYQVGLYAFSEPNPQSLGSGLECMTFDSSENVLMTKQGSDLNFQHVGTISGFVYDAEGNPLGGIGVDTEQGGYGVCTDESGYYVLQNIPDGQVNIVAGREFCGEHPFEEQTLPDVQVGATDVNFYLNIEILQPEFAIIAQPEHEWVFSFGWTIDDEITMYLDTNADPLDGYDVMMTQFAIPTEWDPSIGKVGFDNWAPFDLAQGMYVIVTDGLNTETLLIEGISIDQFDGVADTVSGTALAGRDVGVGVHQPDGDFWLVVTADVDGYWLADFAGQGVDALTVFDIHAMIWDEDGDATQANYNFP